MFSFFFFLGRGGGGLMLKQAALFLFDLNTWHKQISFESTFPLYFVMSGYQLFYKEQSYPWLLHLMTSQAVETTRIRTGGYGRLRGECVLITKPKSCLLPIFSPDFTLNSQIRLFYAEKWIFLKKLCTLLKIRNGYTDCVSSLVWTFWEVMSGSRRLTLSNQIITRKPPASYNKQL